MVIRNGIERTSSMLDCKHNVLQKPILLKMEKEIINFINNLSEEDKDMIVNEISLVIQNKNDINADKKREQNTDG